MSKVVLITGCSTGIGRALAEAFHEAGGYQVYASARRLDRLRELGEQGIHTLPLDVNDEGSIHAAVERIEDEQGRIDVLVNNAGFAAMGPLAELPVEKLRGQFETNVVAPVAISQASLPLLREAVKTSGRARIANIGSVSGILTTPFSGAYCASKAAIHCISDALRMELAPFGIHVVTVQPGGIQSSFGENSAASIDWLDENSLYAPVRAGIEARTRASQDHPTPADEFATLMITAVMADDPDPVVRIGNGSRLLPGLKRWVPLRRLDRMLSRRFRLSELKS